MTASLGSDPRHSAFIAPAYRALLPSATPAAETWLVRTSDPRCGPDVPHGVEDPTGALHSCHALAQDAHRTAALMMGEAVASPSRRLDDVGFEDAVAHEIPATDEFVEDLPLLRKALDLAQHASGLTRMRMAFFRRSAPRPDHDRAYRLFDDEHRGETGFVEGDRLWLDVDLDTEELVVTIGHSFAHEHRGERCGDAGDHAEESAESFGEALVDIIANDGDDNASAE
jgi:hypothetical protein